MATDKAEESHLSVRWEKARALSVILAALALPIVLAIVGNAVTRAQKQQELAVRYVELAVSILRAEPSQDNQALRLWAVNVIDNLSQVPLPAKARDELQLRRLDAQTEQAVREQREMLLDRADKLLRGVPSSAPVQGAIPPRQAPKKE